MSRYLKGFQIMRNSVKYLAKKAKIRNYAEANHFDNVSVMDTKHSRGRFMGGQWFKQITVLLAILVWIPAAQAQIIMFDFGPTAPTGSNLSNSPGHFTGAVSGAQTIWNQVGVSDVTSGLLYANNTAATGISIATGRESTDISNIIDFTTNPGFSAALGSSVNTGVYAGDSVATDGIFHTSTAAFALGVQIDGLAAGTYEVYISGRNTNVASYQQNFYAASSVAGTTFNFGSLSPDLLANSGTAWVENTTYSVFTLTLGVDEVLNIAVSGTGTGAAGRGFLNSVQIVAIPEPSTMGLLGFGAVALLGMIHRKAAKARLSRTSGVSA